MLPTLLWKLSKWIDKIKKKYNYIINTWTKIKIQVQIQISTNYIKKNVSDFNIL